jgi:flagellar FliL protein
MSTKEKTAESEETEGKGGKKKLLLIGLVLLLVAAGAAYYFLFASSGEAEAEEPVAGEVLALEPTVAADPTDRRRPT